MTAGLIAAPAWLYSSPTSFTTSHTASGVPLTVWSGPTHSPWSGGVRAPKSWSLVRSFSPSKAAVTDVLDRFGLVAGTAAAPAPVACAAGFGPPGDLAFVSARGVPACSIAVEGVTCWKPVTPLADAASRVAVLMVPNVPLAAALGVMVAAWAAAGAIARLQSRPAAARIEVRFTGPIPPTRMCVTSRNWEGDSL